MTVFYEFFWILILGFELGVLCREADDRRKYEY